MIATAALILAESYESTHNDEYKAEPGAMLVILMIMMAFDYHMVLAL